MKLLIIGYFGSKKETSYDGQTIKTLNIFNALVEEKTLNVKTLNTKLISKRPIYFFLCLFFKTLFTKKIMIMFSKRGRKVLFPYFFFISKIFHKEIYHNCIAGNLSNEARKRKKYRKYLKSFKVNWVENDDVLYELKSLGITNCEKLNNFKIIEPVKQVDIYNKKPLRICTFSRVCQNKGIEDAVLVINQINKEAGSVIYHLDIYGNVFNEDKKWFELLSENFNDNIKFCGPKNPNESVKILKDYFFLLFPTKYENEGIPGTIIDCFAAGLPIVSAEWKHAHPLLTKDNSITYKFNDIKELKDVLLKIANNPLLINNLREGSRNSFNDFDYKKIRQSIIQKIINGQ